MPKHESIIFLCLFGLFLPLFYVFAGIVVSPHQYAWSDNVGYINFKDVIVSDSALEGHAWSTNKGFIKFNPAQGGVLNDGTGNLSGYAWGEQLGWIDFSGVSINGSTGKFSGVATGVSVGTITFDCPNYCDVQTDWRQIAPSVPAPAPDTSSVSGGGGLIASQIAIPIIPIQDITQSAQAKLMDIQKDGIINILDFNAMMVNWGLMRDIAFTESVFNSADMNKDGVVDIFDFNTLMVYWGIMYSL